MMNPDQFAKVQANISRFFLATNSDYSNYYSPNGYRKIVEINAPRDPYSLAMLANSHEVFPDWRASERASERQSLRGGTVRR